ncbi:DUF1641 domain-containing protein [Halobacillus yeomjeoni]|uniref:DUF1641 domain-containing protein n=1 Tax=Halobacillus yeomjeoni TaxID=311194 RepID=A0A931HSP8_9BACI|nr:DUF1641 domain-containing protein [Halobacillus yeomjeoni]MBH0228894.1 DUF1641 domain-containing protein [Halobacillus yeomjeoni]MCA0983726.1 DUF1641 domain-containing protein [Halobacillus yeomjeoni]
MAKPISNIKKYEKTHEEEIDQNVAEVKAAVSDNKDAILKGIQLLKALEEGGTLDTAYAFTKKKKEALGYVVEEISKEQYTPLLKNLPELIFLLGEIDVKALREFSSKLNQGLEQMDTGASEEKTGFLDLAKALKDPEINRSITMLLQFLRGMGR